MRTERPGFLVYYDIMDSLEEFTAAEAGQFLRAMCDYSRDGTEPDFVEKGLRALWKMAKGTLDRDSEKYTDRCTKNRYNAYLSALKRDYQKKHPGKTPEEGVDYLSFEDWRKSEIEANVSDRKRSLAIVSQPDINYNQTITKPDINYNQTITKPDSSFINMSSEQIAICLNDGSLFTLTPEYITELQKSFPLLDIVQELHKMEAWTLCNPKKRKSRDGVKAFVFRWLSRAQERGEQNQQDDTDNVFLKMYEEERDQ